MLLFYLVSLIQIVCKLKRWKYIAMSRPIPFRCNSFHCKYDSDGARERGYQFPSDHHSNPSPIKLSLPTLFATIVSFRVKLDIIAASASSAPGREQLFLHRLNKTRVLMKRTGIVVSYWTCLSLTSSLLSKLFFVLSQYLNI